MFLSFWRMVVSDVTMASPSRMNQIAVTCG